MKTKIIIPVIVLSLALITKSVFAKNEAITGIQKKEVQATASQVREEKKSVLSELKIKNSTAIYNAIKMGLTKRYAALEKIKNKLEARMTKNPMKRDLESIENIKTKLDDEFGTAKTSYDQHILDLETQFNELNSSAKPSTLVKGLKDTVNLIRQDLNTIKKAIRDAVVALAQAPKLEVTKTK